MARAASSAARARRPAARALVGAALAGLACAGCAVDVQAGATDAAPCTPSTAYFVTDVRLRYLDRNHCADAGCHAFADGHGYLRLRPFGAAPDPATPLAAWPDAWRENYRAATQLVRCDRPLESRLLTVPEGRADPHPPGPAVDAPADAEALFADWARAP